jgi:CheY-like chemotaxis protein
MISVKCPKCSAPFTAAPDENGAVTCPACNTRLRAQPPAASATPHDLQVLLGEIRDLRRMQGEILQYVAQMLALLKSWPPPAHGETDAPEAQDTASSEAPADDETPPARLPKVRQRRKTVLLVDDDPEARAAAQAALESAQVPVHAVAGGNAALAVLAADKPDILVLELAVGEPMPGRDLVNYVKATMEWVDIPIVLYTRLPIQSQQEARTVHGADEVVLKGPGSPEALLNRVIQVFQRR